MEPRPVRCHRRPALLDAGVQEQTVMRRAIFTAFVLIALSTPAAAQEYILQMLPIANSAGTGALSDFALDSATDAFSVVFPCHVPGVIDTLLVRYGTRTGTPPTYRI